MDTPAGFKLIHSFHCNKKNLLMSRLSECKIEEDDLADGFVLFPSSSPHGCCLFAAPPGAGFLKMPFFLEIRCNSLFIHFFLENPNGFIQFRINDLDVDQT
jgi:hypothetical protein